MKTKNTKNLHFYVEIKKRMIYKNKILCYNMSYSESMLQIT